MIVTARRSRARLLPVFDFSVDVFYDQQIEDEQPWLPRASVMHLTEVASRHSDLRITAAADGNIIFNYGSDQPATVLESVMLPGLTTTVFRLPAELFRPSVGNGPFRPVSMLGWREERSSCVIPLLDAIRFVLPASEARADADWDGILFKYADQLWRLTVDPGDGIDALLWPELDDDGSGDTVNTVTFVLPFGTEQSAMDVVLWARGTLTTL